MSELGHLLVQAPWIWASVFAAITATLVFVLAVVGGDWAPIMVMATVPIQREWLFGPDDAHLTITQVALWAFLAGALLRFARGKLRVAVDATTTCMGILVSIFGLSVIVAPDIRLWAGESYRWLVAALFFIFARAYFGPKAGVRLVIVLSVGALSAAALAASQVLLDSGPASFVRDGRHRAYGWFGEPNPFAAFIWCITLPIIAFALYSSGQRRMLRIVTGMIGTVGLIALGLTQSRGGMIGVTAGMLVIVVMILSSRRRSIRLTAGIATAIFAALALLMLVRVEPWSALRASTTPGNWAEQERAAHWTAAIAMVQENPISGVGAGGFGEQYRAYSDNWRFRISRGHAHNAYLQVAAEAGLPGLLAYGLMLGAIVAALIRRMRLAANTWLPLGAVAVSAALLAHQAVDFLHVLSLGLLFAGLWAASLPSGQKGTLSRGYHIAL